MTEPEKEIVECVTTTWGGWKSIALTSISVNVTGLGAWLLFGMSAVTHTQLEKAILSAPYPWKEDRGIVLQHITDPTVHENDNQKRARIQQELKSALAPLQAKLEYITKQQDKILRDLEELMP